MVRDLVRSLLILLAVFCGMSFGSAAERLGDYNFRDLWQTVRARKALADDPALAPLNLGVHVQGGIAFLWGPAPSVELAFRAEARLRAMIELIDVHNSLEIAPDPLGPARLPFTPPRLLPDRLPPPLPDMPRTPLTNPWPERDRPALTLK